MSENNNKISYAKNLNKQNFSVSVSMPIDNNVNIKTILEIDSYMFDERVECGNGKAILSGKLGVKVLYIDTDNMTNTLNTTTTINETILDNAITNDCFLNIADTKIINQILSKVDTLKINLDISVNPVMYINLKVNTNIETDNMITKTKEISTNEISNYVDSMFDYTINLETKDNISKILYHNSWFASENITPYEDRVVVEGKLFSILVYETLSDNENVIKKLMDTTTVKSELPLTGLADCLFDVNFYIDKSKQNIETAIEENNSVITITNAIKVKGVCLKQVNLNIVEDLYSTTNDIELSLSKRDLYKMSNCRSLTETIIGETNINENETAVDEIVANVDILPEIINKYIKDNYLYVEGVISSCVIYLDEFREYKQKLVEIPFVVNTKIELEKLDCVHANISILDTRAKAKRGTILEIEYLTCLNLCIYTTNEVEIIDNIQIKNPLDFGGYDYQIYLAKPMETMWELGKRLHMNPDDILAYNKNLPLIMEGKEKIIIKR